MPSYFVESYSSEGAVDEARARAELTAALEGAVHYLRTTFLPGEETVFHAFEAPSADVLRRAARQAALSYERIVEAIESTAVLRAPVPSPQEGEPR
jgi:hypothetical protein